MSPLPLGLPGPLGWPFCSPNVLLQADVLDLFDRILPDWYLEALKNPGPGYELLMGYAQMISRVSEAIGNLECGVFIGDAAGGTKAEGKVQFSRPTHAAGAVTVKAGTVVRTSVGGRQYVVTGDVAFGALDLGPLDASVVAVARGWEWNVPGALTTARGEVVAGSVDTIELPLLDPPFGDTTFVVSQAADITGGAGAMLDALGADRGVPRASPTEPDPSYRKRIRQLPDVVSPDAIVRQVNAFVRPFVPTFDARVEFVETWDVRYQTCWFGPPVLEGGLAADQPRAIPTTSGFNPDLFCYDDPRQPTDYPTIRDRWLGEDDFRGAFFVVVPNLPAMTDVGMAYDDTAQGPADLVTSVGKRAVGAYDVPVGLISTELQGGYDGFDLGKQAFYLGLYNLLQDIKAGGIFATLELAGQ